MNNYFKLMLVLLCSVILGVILGFNRIHIEFKDWVIIYFGVIIGALLLVLIRGINNLNSLYKGEYSKAIESFKKTMKKHGRNTKIVNAMLYNIAVCYYRKGDFYDIENNYFIGMTYLKLKEPQLAKEHFSKASKSQYKNYFSKKAGAYL